MQVWVFILVLGYGCGVGLNIVLVAAIRQVLRGDLEKNHSGTVFGGALLGIFWPVCLPATFIVFVAAKMYKEGKRLEEKEEAIDRMIEELDEME